MAAPLPEPAHPPRSAARVVSTKVFVRGITLEAEVGVYAHERGRPQPLVIDVELDIAAAGFERLGDTINYESILTAAKDVAAEGHIELVEVFAERLADRCFADPRVSRARVRVEKPQALAPDAQAAGVEITAVRA